MDLNLRGRGIGIIEFEDLVLGLLEEFIPSFVAPPNQLLKPIVDALNAPFFVGIVGNSGNFN